ncbi:MAG TPA: HIT domain-containing protein [Phycisphaerae bacterium]|nr:HIT domain-containing protein [Phycisphaerae bacterium]
MSDESHNADRKRNIHAPWRIEYIESLGNDDGCFLCNARQQEGKDEENLLLWRTDRCIVVMNKFPYTAGHLLVAPAAHVGNLADLAGDVLVEIMELTRDGTVLLTETIGAEGFNVGMNVGRCAGAGLPGHLHLHVVPRWQADTNFMAVLGDVRVIPESLSRLRRKLLAKAEELKIPVAVYGR